MNTGKEVKHELKLLEVDEWELLSENGFKL
jgi:hypothetical protein